MHLCEDLSSCVPDFPFVVSSLPQEYLIIMKSVKNKIEIGGEGDL